MNSAKWPKTLAPLTQEQKLRHDEFMRLWHEHLPKKYGALDSFNHGFPVRHSQPGFRTTLEIGAGLGEHLNYENLTPEQRRGYYCNEFRENMAAEIKRRHPDVNTVVGDCQKRMDFTDGFFDRVIAVHVLEHLPDLPGCIREVHRLIDKKKGRFLIVIPTEGTPAYSLARKISADRLWRRHFAPVDYAEFYTREHINLPKEILGEVDPYFEVATRSFFPLRIPLIDLNLVVGYALVPRPAPLA